MAGVLLMTGSTHSPLLSEERNRAINDNCTNFIVISGQSNVNRFSFKYTSSSSDLANSHFYPSLFQGNEIKIPVREFEPSNPLMYNDFLTHLHEHQYPDITIKFSDLGLNNVIIPFTDSMHEVMITIAGVTRDYNIDCIIQNCGTHYILRGSKIVRLTDFHITPPEKLTGLVKVKDEITVSFGIILNFTADNSLPPAK